MNTTPRTPRTCVVTAALLAGALAAGFAPPAPVQAREHARAACAADSADACRVGVGSTALTSDAALPAGLGASGDGLARSLADRSRGRSRRAAPLDPFFDIRGARRRSTSPASRGAPRSASDPTPATLDLLARAGRLAAPATAPPHPSA